MSKVTPVNTTEMTVNMSTQNDRDDYKEDYKEAKVDQVTCCGCLKIETGMKCIMFYQIFDSVTGIFNVVGMVDYGAVIVTMEAVFSWFPKLLMAILWIYWFRNDNAKVRNTLSKVYGYYFYWTVFHTLVYLVWLYVHSTSDEEIAKRSKADFIEGTFIGICGVSTLVFILTFYIWVIVKRYQKLMDEAQ